eukprot:CAMPEP_0185287604 /NCGR_PEP_ID=MMETSP1363-20130426/2913_1 /TAXON_ID=38817 /ORGANISM="Gephyrocapsa oceanica, Strain RCC1303" /LENGTH=60 /DNA_ID=CAMNT_0027883457 /DNA_START=224 /DNA_END=406 /DNA_ORIENTATION=-
MVVRSVFPPEALTGENAPEVLSWNSHSFGSKTSVRLGYAQAVYARELVAMGSNLPHEMSR